jgi:hypothetical protein
MERKRHNFSLCSRNRLCVSKMKRTQRIQLPVPNFLPPYQQRFHLFSRQQTTFISSPTVAMLVINPASRHEPPLRKWRFATLVLWRTSWWILCGSQFSKARRCCLSLNVHILFLLWISLGVSCGCETWSFALGEDINWGVLKSNCDDKI